MFKRFLMYFRLKHFIKINRHWLGDNQCFDCFFCPHVKSCYEDFELPPI